MSLPIEAQAEPVTSYRGFRATRDGWLLSPMNERLWTPGLNRASCDVRRHRAPAEGCTCGFWSYREPMLAVRYFGYDLGPSQQDLHLIVEVLGYGRIIVADDGYRTEVMKVNALLDVEQGVDLTPWMERYDVPAVRSELDVAIVIEGTLTALGEDVGQLNRIGIRIDSRQLVVSMHSLIVFQLYSIPLGTRVRVVRDPLDMEVVGVRVLDAHDGEQG